MMNRDDVALQTETGYSEALAAQADLADRLI